MAHEAKAETKKFLQTQNRPWKLVSKNVKKASKNDEEEEKSFNDWWWGAHTVDTYV